MDRFVCSRCGLKIQLRQLIRSGSTVCPRCGRDFPFKILRRSYNRKRREKEMRKHKQRTSRQEILSEE